MFQENRKWRYIYRELTDVNEYDDEKGIENLHPESLCLLAYMYL